MKIEKPFFDFSTLKRERVADQCVCCGNSDILRSPAILMPFVAHRVFDWEPVEITKDWELNTIKQGIAYSICNSILCTNCSFLFLDIRFSEHELKKLYSDYRGKSYTELREKYEPGYTLRNHNLNEKINYIDEIEHFISPHIPKNPKILDWGGHIGINTPFYGKAEGIFIYDISDNKTIPGTQKIMKTEISNHYFDLVICSNVLEHTPYPSDITTEISKTLGKASKLYIEVPLEDLMLKNEDALHQKKKHWHEHINFFSEKSLISLLRNSGLKIEEINTVKTKIAGNEKYLLQVICSKA